MSLSRSIIASPSIAVVQRVYGSYCAPPETQTECYSEPLDWLDDFQQTALIVDSRVEDWLKFQHLVTEWQAERGAMSSVTEVAMCPAYQSMIGMGQSVVPFILMQLRSEADEPDQWFWALKAITGADPVRDEDRGDFTAMAKAWLQWAEESRAW